MKKQSATKLPADKKIEIVEFAKENGVVAAEERYHVHRNYIYNWKALIDNGQTDLLKPVGMYSKFDDKIKLKALTDYESGRYTKAEICRKYGIRGNATLDNWIKRYNSVEELLNHRNNKRLVKKMRTPSVSKKQFITRVNELKSVEEAALELGVPRSTAFNWNARYKELGEAFFAHEENEQTAPVLNNLEAVLNDATKYCWNLITSNKNNPDIMQQAREYVLEVTKPYKDRKRVHETLELIDSMAKNVLQMTGDLNTMKLVVEVKKQLDSSALNKK